MVVVGNTNFHQQSSKANAIIGGFQNTGAKKKEPKEAKKTGGFRGLKGIM
jgi:hypothetical protein